MKSLQGVEDLDPRVTVVKETASVIPFLIKTTVLLGIGYVAYRAWTIRFVPMKENKNYAVSNVTSAQASSRADAIYNSTGLFSDDFNAVAQALAGLNYNGFVKVYNAFGSRGKIMFVTSGDNMIEFIKSKFSDYEVQQLSMLLNGVFF